MRGALGPLGALAERSGFFAGREVSLARLGAGEYVGEMALLNQATRNATVRCLEPLDVLSIHKREFSVLAANLGAGCLDHQSTGLRATQGPR